MSILVWAVLFFIIAFSIHAVIWRLRYPANPIKVLIILFGIVGITGTIGLLNFAKTVVLCYIFLVFFSFFICYLITYTAIDSPSLRIIMRVSFAGKKGIDYKKIRESLCDDLLVGARLEDLVGAGLVGMSGCTCRIKKKGILFIWPFIVYRNFLGLKKGG